MVKISICIDVPDLRAATTFYCDVLGCSVEKQQASHNTLSAGGVTMHLLLKEAGTAAAGNGTCARTYERHWTPVHLDFDVDDVDAALAVVERSGGTVEIVNRGEWGASATCVDLFGNGFCLVSLRAPSSGA
jgi:predicted enzyme related to lactoylglutathione lyase